MKGQSVNDNAIDLLVWLLNMKPQKQQKKNYNYNPYNGTNKWMNESIFYNIKLQKWLLKF